MCLQTILSFTKCHHKAQTLTLCGRNGASSRAACRSFDGRFIQRDAFCDGCHRALILVGPGASFEDLDEVEGIKHNMPFSYVVYGLPPWSRPAGARAPDWEHMLVRTPGCGVDPLEEMVARMAVSGERDEQERTSRQPAAFADKGEQSPSRREPERAQVNRGPSSHRNKRPASSLASKLPSKTHQQNTPHSLPDKKSSSRSSSWPPRRSSSASRPEKPPSTASKKAASRPPSQKPAGASTSPGPKKRVSFACAAEVQYFRKDLAPGAVKHRWTGPDRDFARETLAA